MRKSMLAARAAFLLAGILCAGTMSAGGSFAEAADAPDYDFSRFETDDGHIYYLVLSDCTWSEALERAQEAGGYLVNIDGWSEYSTILHKIIDFGLTDIRFRIGARREEDSHDYHWIDDLGEPVGDVINDPSYWSWSRWITGGPSFYANGFDEDVLEIMFYSKENRFVWNDVPDDIVASSDYFAGRVGYIVEFDPASDGYEDASMGWDRLDAGFYDEISQSGDMAGLYDPATQSGDDAGLYDPATQSGDDADLYDLATQSGEDGYEGPDGILYPEEVGDDPSALLSLLPDDYVYTSGVGAWSTTLHLNDDGTFYGVYHDFNAGEDSDKYPGGTEYLCVFQGYFTDFVRTDRYAWTMALGDLSYESQVGDNWFDETDQIHYIAAGAEGLEGGKTFRLYLKGHPADTLPDDFTDWVPDGGIDPDEDILDTFGIWNEADGSGFVQD